jgi:hypothetical protein
VLIVLQALDTGGKDGVINHVLQGRESQKRCIMESRKEPRKEESQKRFQIDKLEERIAPTATGQQGYEGQPGNQGNGLRGYEGQPGNQGGH